MLVLAIEHHLHRHARLLREPRANQALGAELQLAAEPAAHVLTDDADVRLGNLQAPGKVVARGVDALRRHPRRQLVAVPLAHRAVRLHAGMRDDVGRIGLLERMRGGLESRREIADFLSIRLADVAVREYAFGRAAGQRRLDADHRRQRLVLHLHRARGVDGMFFGVRRDGRDLVALEHHDIRLLVFRIANDERRLETGHALGGREIDREDLRARVR